MEVGCGRTSKGTEMDVKQSLKMTKREILAAFELGCKVGKILEMCKL